MPLLDIKNLTLEIDSPVGWVKALDKISLTVDRSEIRALVGESGSGKSLIVKAIVGALPEQWRVTADRMQWKGKDLLSMSAKERRHITRHEISVILQNPVAALDPSAKLHEQIEESIPDNMLDRAWFWQRREQRRILAVQQLHKVGIKHHEEYMDSYPHEVPEDICQKFYIAMALVSKPELLIADNPTMGMEPTSKVQVVKLLNKLNKTRSLSLLFVSHDLQAIFSIAKSLTVLYCGQTVESGPLDKIRKRPLHPYTNALLESAPSFRRELPPKSPLSCLDGTIPTLQHLPIGCRLGPRCPRAQKACVKMPATRRIHDHNYACHFPLHRGHK
ncbi:Dipeptide transport ATP-binding protein DppD [Saliniradius amylolyticus]|uniref:Dipeptide transport ATP-binding protein DppD n=1 Tax=Saliniradius amylolyticus TaxID=2183582 RepID=A0A2S2E160_9ALTE|nr:oligopeptide/dipeptide ABC transporter ATP-binding protein [Saliniradius amylolyticus]AWL11329.1 Dipeptide transport ATP-binding protein DppD [Saliniradius amylolyticus]